MGLICRGFRAMAFPSVPQDLRAGSTLFPTPEKECVRCYALANRRDSVDRQSSRSPVGRSVRRASTNIGMR